MSKLLLALCVVLVTFIQISAYLETRRPRLRVKSSYPRTRLNVPYKLECQAEGKTPMTISWKINNTEFDPEVHKRYSIEIEKRGLYKDYMYSTLSITRTERSDSGVFTCTAINSFGHNSVDINLLVEEPPEAPYDLKVLTNFDQTLEFSWKEPYDGNSAITRYVVDQKLDDLSWENSSSFWSDDTKVAIFATAGTTYHFRVRAINDVGTSEPSEILTVVTAKVVPDVPTDVRVEKSQHFLDVFWKPPVKDEWNVTVSGYQVGFKLAESEKPYDVLTMEPEQEAQEYHLKITNLKSYTQYSVVVRAFNERGAGEWSDEIKIYTEEGVPERAPKNPKCGSGDYQSIYFKWEPLTTGANGVVIGYKVIFAPSESWLNESTRIKKVTNGPSTSLLNLQKYTNYTMQVSALTSKGGGPATTPIECHTSEYVPGPPAAIKVVVASSDSIYVVWKPPLKPDGILIYYTVYCKKEEDDPKTHVVRPDLDLSVLVQNLNISFKYEFWVTAATTFDEGPPSEKITVSLSNNVPARIVTYGSTFTTTYEENVVLPCPAVRALVRIWQIKGVNFTTYEERPSGLNNMEFRPDDSLFIRHVRRKDAGEYSCYVENNHGQDSVTHKLVVNGPPGGPHVRLVSSTTDSLTLELEPHESDVKTIRKYVIHYKPKSGNWKNTEVLVPNVGKYTLEELRCGTRYLVYVEAYNSFGKGEPSDILSTKTRGHKPVVPTEAFVKPSCYNITFHLNLWFHGGCPISNFTIEYKEKGSTEWIEQTFDVNLDGKFVLLDLKTNVTYKLQVTAWNDAGFSKFKTEASIGGDSECNLNDSTESEMVL